MSWLTRQNKVTKNKHLTPLMNRKRDHIASKVASITGYSYDYVRRIRNGERDNERVESLLMELVEAEKTIEENYKKTQPLRDYVQELIPFNQPNK